MKTSTKILIFIGSALTIGVAGYLIYRKVKSKPVDGAKKTDDTKKTEKDKVNQTTTQDVINLEIVNTDWVNRSVTFRVLLNNKTYMSEKIQWENKYTGSEFGFVGSPLYSPTNQIEIVGVNLTNGLILVVKSNNVIKAGKIVNFATKTVADYNGNNLTQDIAKMKELSKSILSSLSFFDGQGFSSADATPPPNPYNHTQKWIYIIENGKDYCRWFDQYGRNTVTYERPCNLAQSNMYSDRGSYYKKEKKRRRK
jgi:hypothetical protein